MQNKMVYKPCLIQLLIDGSHKMKEFTHVDVKRSLIMICKLKKNHIMIHKKKSCPITLHVISTLF